MDKNMDRPWIVTVLKGDKQEHCPVSFPSIEVASEIARIVHHSTGLPAFAWHKDNPVETAQLKEIMAKHESGDMFFDSRNPDVHLDMSQDYSEDICEDCGEKGCIGSKLRKLQAEADQEQDKQLAQELMDMLRDYSGPSAS